MEYRIERDSIGEVKVESTKYWAAQTQRSLENFKIGNQVMPWNITESYERDTGIWNKGDNKAWAAFLKLMGFSGYNMKPGEAVKAFESSFFR